MKTRISLLSAVISVALLAGCSEPQTTTKKEPATQSQQNAVALDGKIRTTAQQTLEAFNIPGLAVVAVKDGEVILAEGFGVRDIESQAPVTKNTLFGIASHTKAFTAAAIAHLVDQGKLDWDDKVTAYLPEFKLSDPELTHRLTIRDLLSHRSGLGLGAGDLMIWPNTDKSVDEIIAGIANVPIEHGFRAQFAYNNLMFLTAGEVVHRVTGVPYAEYIKQTFFEPLNMDESVVGFSNIPAANDNVAVGTIEKDGELHRFPLDYLEDFGGAGATAGSVDDMGHWLITQLQHGKSPSGEQVFSPESQHEMWQLITPIGVSDKAAEQGTFFQGYGLGWFVKDYHGVKQVYHSGGILGMLSLTTLIPEENFGITVVSNQQAFGGLTAITQEALEQVLNLPDQDWVAEQSENYRQFMQRKTDFKIPKPDTEEDATLAKQEYAGTYTDAWYGDIDIRMQGDELRLDFTHTPMLKGTLTHYNGDTFIVHWDEPLLEADAYVRFELNEDDAIKQATMEAVAPFTDFSFDFHNLTLVRQ